MDPSCGDPQFGEEGVIKSGAEIVEGVGAARLRLSNELQIHAAKPSLPTQLLRAPAYPCPESIVSSHGV